MRNKRSILLCTGCLWFLALAAPSWATPPEAASPLTIRMQQMTPEQHASAGTAGTEGLRVGALICRPLAEQGVDRNRPGGGLRLDVPLEWLDGYVAARSGTRDVPFRHWQQGDLWTSILPVRLRDACAAAPAARLVERWQLVREKLVRQQLSLPCRQFRQQGDNWLPLVLWWDGYQAFGEDREYVPLELGTMAARSEALLDWCRKHPDTPLEKALEQLDSDRAPRAR